MIYSNRTVTAVLSDCSIRASDRSIKASWSFCLIFVLAVILDISLWIFLQYYMKICEFSLFILGDHPVIPELFLKLKALSSNRFQNLFNLISGTAAQRNVLTTLIQYAWCSKGSISPWVCCISVKLALLDLFS